jgi:hypothetical protein
MDPPVLGLAVDWPNNGAMNALSETERGGSLPGLDGGGMDGSRWELGGFFESLELWYAASLEETGAWGNGFPEETILLVSGIAASRSIWP